MWTCGKCAYAYNPVRAANCDICKRSRSPGSNGGRRSRSHSRENKSAMANHNNNGLEDDFQFVSKELLNRVVEGCSDGEVENGEGEEVWSCHRCTLENPGEILACLACGAKRVSVPDCTVSTVK